MYELTCPTCQNIRRFSFIRTGARSVCTNCRQAFIIQAAYVNRTPSGVALSTNPTAATANAGPLNATTKKPSNDHKAPSPELTNHTAVTTPSLVTNFSKTNASASDTVNTQMAAIKTSALEQPNIPTETTASFLLTNAGDNSPSLGQNYVYPTQKVKWLVAAGVIILMAIIIVSFLGYNRPHQAVAVQSDGGKHTSEPTSP